MKIERDKVYLTRLAEKVRVVCVDRPGKMSVIAIHNDEVFCHRADGGFYAHGVSEHDLVSEYVEPPKPREVWVYDYSGDLGNEAYLAKPNTTSDGIRVVKFREVIA